MFQYGTIGYELSIIDELLAKRSPTGDVFRCVCTETAGFLAKNGGLKVDERQGKGPAGVLRHVPWGRVRALAGWSLAGRFLAVLRCGVLGGTWLLAALQGGAAMAAETPVAMPVERAADERAADASAPVRRVVSLSPALTESVCVLKACDRLVGVDRFSNWPDTVTRLPHLGSQGSFSVEGIVALRPDVVLMASEGPLAGQLRRLGIAVRVMSPQRRADILQVLRQLAQMLGVPQQRADAVWADIERQLVDLAESVPARARGMRVWLEVDPAPWLATSASLLGETLAGLGLQNVVSDEADAEAAAGSGAKASHHEERASRQEAAALHDGARTSHHEARASRPGAGASHHGARTAGPRKAYLQVSREWILQAQPDLLMISDPQKQGLAAVKARPGWQRVQAIRQGRVCLFEGAQLDALVRPGPRLAEGARQMRDCVVRVLEAGAGS